MDPQAAAEIRDLEKARSAHQKDQVKRMVIGVGAWILIVVVIIIAAATLTILGLHMLAPDDWHWLDDAALDNIKGSVLSGAVVGLGTTYIRRYLDEK